MVRRKKRDPTRDARSAAEERGPSRGRVIRFAILFTILVALGSVSELYLQRYQIRTDRGRDYQHLIAETIGQALRLVHIPARVSDTTIRIHAASIEVAVECTGIKATAIFCAGVLAFPCTWRQKGVGLLTGLIGVSILNTGRITALALVAGYQHDWFDRVHALLMQGFLVLFVAPLWITWMLFVNRRPDHHRSTGATGATAAP